MPDGYEILLVANNELIAFRLISDDYIIRYDTCRSHTCALPAVDQHESCKTTCDKPILGEKFIAMILWTKHDSQRTSILVREKDLLSFSNRR